LFVVDNERGKRVAVTVAGVTEVCPPSRPNGHFDCEVRLSAGSAQAAAGGAVTEPTPLEVRALLSAGDDRHFAGTVTLLPPAGVSVVSDIDDTVKVTDVHDRDELLANTFIRPYRAVDGMADL